MATQLREIQSRLSVLAGRDLRRVWTLVERPEGAREVLHDVLPDLVSEYGLMGATLAADWYDSERDRLGVAGRFQAVVAELKDAGAEALIGWALSQATDLPAFESLILGGTQRRIANYVRETVTTSSTADPKARGWQRVGGGGCDWCQMLVGRGAVYTEATADFEAHDGCRCTAAPVWA